MIKKTRLAVLILLVYLFFGGGKILWAFVDTDGDILPDSWENQYFGSPTAADPDADPDGDGLTNLDEWFAGTHPLEFSTAGTLTERQILKLFQGKSFLYFWEASRPPYYFTHDGADYDGGGFSENHNSIAAIGFSFVAYVIAGHNDWVRREDAYHRIRIALTRLVELQASDPQTSRHGYLYHFIQNDGAREGTSEISTIDHALLTAGALVAASYYRGTEVETLAHQLFDNTEWNWLYDGNVFYQGWNDGCSTGQNCIEGGHTLDYWNRYSELMILLFQAMSAGQGKGVNEHAWQFLAGDHVMFPNEWARLFPGNQPENLAFVPGMPNTSGAPGYTNNSEELHYLHAGSIHNHQYSHMFADFRGRPDGFKQTNFFNNSVSATMANRQYCINLRTSGFSDGTGDPNAYESYDFDSWGLLSGIASTGYDVAQPILKFPADFTFNDKLADMALNNDSGTVFLYAAPGSTAFTPKESIRMMRNILNRFQNDEPWYNDMIGRYGFPNSFNRGYVYRDSNRRHPDGPTGHFASASLGIDQGAMIGGIENYLTGLVWKLAMQQSRITDGMARAGVGFNAGDVGPIVMNFDENNGMDPTAFGGSVGAWGTGSALYENIGDPFPELLYGPQNWAIRISASEADDGAFMTLERHSVSHKDRVSFWIRGNTADEDFSVGLKDSTVDYKGEELALEQHEHKVRISDYLSGGGIPVHWTEARIPLSVFQKAGVRLTRLDNISFTNEKSGGGQIWVDDIAFLGDEFTPSVPQNVRLTVQGNDVMVTWDENPEDDVVGYNVYRREAGAADFTKLTSTLVVGTSFVDPGAAYSTYEYAVTAVDNAYPEQNESDFSNLFFWTIHHVIPYVQKETYSSAAAAKMILNYLGASPSLTQTDIYDYGHPLNLPVNQGPGAELDPKGMDAVLGHFDPYDALLTEPYDFYDSLPDGNPYQGYNFSIISTTNLNDYMRDLAHWMDYPAPLYWGSTEYTDPAKVPPAVPVFGSYNHWVVVNGVSASADPLPDESNPWLTPDFIVYGFWLTDPSVAGIGANRFVTAEEAAATYFKPMVTSDIYHNRYVLVAEPPPVTSTANIQPADFTPKPEISESYRQFAGQTPAAAETDSPLKIFGAKSKPRQPAVFDWSRLIPGVVLRDETFARAFSGTRLDSLREVVRTDRKEKYTIAMFRKRIPHPNPLPRGEGRVRGDYISAGISFRSLDGKFLEAARTAEPAHVAILEKQAAIRHVFLYLRQTDFPNEKFGDWVMFVRKWYGRTAAQLEWQPGSPMSPSPFEPYWRIVINKGVYFVTQTGKVFPPRLIKPPVKPPNPFART